MTPQERRTKSIEILKEQGVPYFEQLPLRESEEEVTPRSAEEIARRAIACLLTIQVACDMAQGNDVENSREIVAGLLEKYGVKDELTEKEKAFYDAEQTLSSQTVVNMAWRYEAYWSLLWALGIVEELDFPCEVCDCDFAIKAVSGCESFDDFMKAVKLRSTSEILDQLDLLYRYHWACTDARINGEEMPAGLSGSVVVERRHGLEWLIIKDTEDDEWDYISLDT
jgi:hypothetical protein